MGHERKYVYVPTVTIGQVFSHYSHRQQEANSILAETDRASEHGLEQAAAFVGGNVSFLFVRSFN